MTGEHQRIRALSVTGHCLAMVLTCTWGCAGSLGTTARSMLTNVRDNKDPNARYQAYVNLGKTRTYDSPEQMLESVAELSRRLMEGKEPPISRAVICRSLGELKRPEARDALLKAMDDEDDEVRAEAARALGKVGKPEDAVLLSRMMAIDTTHNGRVAAAEGLANLKPTDPRIMISLSESLNNDDPAMRLAAYRALKQITGADPGPGAEVWHEYLAANFPGYTGDTQLADAKPAKAKASGDTSVKPAGLPAALGQLPFMPGAKAPAQPPQGLPQP